MEKELAPEDHEDFNFYRKHKKIKREIKGSYEDDRLGPLIKQARLALGLTKLQLAQRCGMSESKIVAIEHDAKDTRMSTLRKVIELGLGGTLEFSIHL